MNDPRGSVWRKWDLHVHTPLSLVQEYGGDQDEVWSKFISDLESLPDEIDVLGINDYLFLDGYRRVLEYREQGRLSNIRLVLPVVELRFAMFGGSGGPLSRANYHVIFSDELEPEDIQAQFLNRLSTEYKLSPSAKAAEWAGTVLTMDSLEDLGRLIKEETPNGKKPSGSSRMVGFSNLNFPLDKIEEALDNSHLQGKYLTALGKTEWSQIRWEQAAADKMNLANRVDFMFVASNSPDKVIEHHISLRENQINDRVLDCSDAHYFSDSNQPNRIGNCHTWIKGDPTFISLKLASLRYDQRVAAVEWPKKVERVKLNKTKYISGITIKKCKDNNLEEVWFDTDTLALCGKTSRRDFSFLSKNRFLKDGKAGCFEAELRWADGSSHSVRLDDIERSEEPDRVRYLPQKFFDRVTNDLNTTEGSDFDDELKKVVFSHIPAPKRLGCETLRDLLLKHTQAVRGDLETLRTAGRSGMRCAEAEKPPPKGKQRFGLGIAACAPGSRAFSPPWRISSKLKRPGRGRSGA